MKALKPPHRDLTYEEKDKLNWKMIELVGKFCGCNSVMCSPGENGKYPVCGTCWDLHMDLGCDPYCVDHG
jgi:hypothetical protein